MILPDRNVLFINHDGARTGAPIIFMNFLRWFKDNTDIPFQILSKNGGDLEHEMHKLAPVSYYNNKQTIKKKCRSEYLGSRVQSVMYKIHCHTLKNKLIQSNIGLVYSNTITNGEVLEYLSDLGCPVITHVHELDYWIQKMGPVNLEQNRKYSQHYIAVSNAVKQNLIGNHCIPENKIEVVHGFIPLDTFEYRSENSFNLRQSLNIPNDALIVGSSGMETWRKGKDLFIQLALNVVLKCTDKSVHFVWIGGRPDKAEIYQIKHDTQHAGISDIIHYVEHVSNPLDYYNQFDVFAMISREDPFPLVNLEVAALGKPIVCFENAGGTPEFVGNEAGFVVPYLDVNAMADKIIILVEDADLRKRLGDCGMQKVKESHGIAVGAQKITKIIERYL
jgi:glycosyltransferase involved in cell wall biosynthesis